MEGFASMFKAREMAWQRRVNDLERRLAELEAKP